MPAQPDPAVAVGLVADGDREAGVTLQVRRPAPADAAVEDDLVAVERVPVTAWRGLPSGSVVAMVANWVSSRKARTRSGRVVEVVGVGMIRDGTRAGRRRPAPAGRQSVDARASRRGRVIVARSERLFDALGQQASADPPAEGDECLDERLLGVVASDGGDDRPGRS